jgi:hypothetical protein
VIALCAVPMSAGMAEATGTAAAVAAATGWVLAGAGIDALAAVVTSPGPSRRGLTMVLAAWVAALPIAGVHAPTGEAPREGYGHGFLSLRRFQLVTGQQPLRAALVEEDASVALLVRANAPERRAAGRSVVLVPRAAELWPRAGIGATPVYALPLASAYLADRGAVLEPALGSARVEHPVPGLTRVTAVLPCASVGAAWTDVSAAFAKDRVALVAAEGADRGPVVVFLAGDSPFDVVASGWPVRARRGFHLRRFDRERRRDLDALAEEAAAEAFDVRVLDQHRFAARILLFRTPDAPSSLAVDITARTALAAARLQAGAVGGRICLCPSSVPPSTRLR